MDLKSLAVAQLTTDPGWDLDPDWSPRGDRIVYASKRTGDGDLWILIVPKDLTWISQGELSR
jgi:Tol biopolymer transport system component